MSSCYCLRLRLELDSTNNGFQLAPTPRSEAGSREYEVRYLCSLLLYLDVRLLQARGSELGKHHVHSILRAVHIVIAL